MPNARFFFNHTTIADLLLDVILIEQIIFSFQVFTYSLHKKVETEGN